MAKRIATTNRNETVNQIAIRALRDVLAISRAQLSGLEQDPFWTDHAVWWKGQCAAIEQGIASIEGSAARQTPEPAPDEAEIADIFDELEREGVIWKGADGRYRSFRHDGGKLH